jgi:hypothetical protein
LRNKKAPSGGHAGGTEVSGDNDPWGTDRPQEGWAKLTTLFMKWITLSVADRQLTVTVLKNFRRHPKKTFAASWSIAVTTRSRCRPIDGRTT